MRSSILTSMSPGILFERGSPLIILAGEGTFGEVHRRSLGTKLAVRVETEGVEDSTIVGETEPGTPAYWKWRLESIDGGEIAYLRATISYGFQRERALPAAATHLGYVGKDYLGSFHPGVVCVMRQSLM